MSGSESCDCERLAGMSRAGSASVWMPGFLTGIASGKSISLVRSDLSLRLILISSRQAGFVASATSSLTDLSKPI